LIKLSTILSEIKISQGDSVNNIKLTSNPPYNEEEGFYNLEIIFEGKEYNYGCFKNSPYFGTEMNFVIYLNVEDYCEKKDYWSDEQFEKDPSSEYIALTQTLDNAGIDYYKDDEDWLFEFVIDAPTSIKKFESYIV